MSVINTFFVLLIRGYQRIISPWLAPRCRFRPTCSQYAIMVYQRFGFWRASWLACKRLSKCHPFHPGGVDLVPGEHDDKC